jgi:hypothetical protein
MASANSLQGNILNADSYQFTSSYMDPTTLTSNHLENNPQIAFLRKIIPQTLRRETRRTRRR